MNMIIYGFNFRFSKKLLVIGNSTARTGKIPPVCPLQKMQILGNDPFTFREGLANFNEHDITSLFSVISGHFLLGGSPDVENFNFEPSHVCPEPACGKKFNSATVLEKHRKEFLLLSLVSISSTSYLTLFAQEPQPQSHKAAAGLALQ